MIKGLHHNAYRCRDSEETRVFYEDFLGLPLAETLPIGTTKTGRETQVLHTFYQLGDGWYLNSAPIITVDWQAESGQRWKVPFGAGGGKVMFWGKLPVNVQAQAYTFVEKPDVGPEWQLRVQVQVLLPAPGGGS